MKMKLLRVITAIGILFIPTNALSKPVLSVLDFSGEGASKPELLAISTLLASAIFETDLVEVIDRSRRDEILQEIELSLSDCSDQECAIEVGRLLSADIIVIGSLNPVGSRLALDLKALEVQSSKIIGAFYQLYDSIDSIVDNVQAIGGQLAQNITGLLASKREILKYEELVPLTIRCDLENARVYIDNSSVGFIDRGLFTKALNRGAEVTVKVTLEGYYGFEETLVADKAITVEALLHKKELNHFAVEFQLGGGIASSFLFTYYLKPDWWYLKLGVGITPVSATSLFLRFPLSFSFGKYIINTELDRLRLYLGSQVLWDGIGYTSNDGLWVNNSLVWLNLHYGLHSGVEYRIAKALRMSAELRFFLDKLIPIDPTVVQIGIALKHNF